MTDVQKSCPLTAVEAIDTIEEIAGLFPAYRRAHAKGIGFDATFSPNGCAAPYTTAITSTTARHFRNRPFFT